MDEMFGLPWHVIGRKGAGLTEGKDSMAVMVGKSDKERLAGLEEGHAEHAERAERVEQDHVVVGKFFGDC